LSESRRKAQCEGPPDEKSVESRPNDSRSGAVSFTPPCR
jgi:hypothetical protein